MEDFTKVIKGCIDKDHKYQQILYEQYRGYAFKVVFRYIYKHEHATDTVNDGFVKLLNNIDKFEIKDDVDDEKLFMGWLKKIMINISIDRLRREKLNTDTTSIDESAWQLPDETGNAAAILFYNDLITLIKELPSAYRMVFNLHVIDGYSHVEIAEMIDIPVSTSRSNLLRARTILQKNIIKLESDYKVCSM
ncbi:MAG: sigma-70 family RNA polymerase sigma factor [Parafilimonas sp.]